MAPSIDAPSARLHAAYAADEPGAVLLVARGSEVLLREAVGMADVELGVALDPTMSLRIGSITKQFTAIAILQLAEAARLALDDSLARFLPDFPGAAAITVEHLLTHTSGLRSYTDMPEFWQRDTIDADPETFTQFFAGAPAEFAPGTAYKYCNSGYFLLGRIIEIASGVRYERYLRESVFAPAGLAATRYDKPLRITPGRAKGYLWYDGRWLNAPYTSMELPFAAGALASTVDDLLRWNRALDSGSVVSDAAFERARRPARLADGAQVPYGCGWCIGEHGGERLSEHGGEIHGFRCHMIRAEDSGVLVVLLANGGRVDPGDFAFEALCDVLDAPYRAPSAAVGVDAGTWTGAYAADRFTLRVEASADGIDVHGLRAEALPFYAIGDDEFAARAAPWHRISFASVNGRPQLRLAPRGMVPWTLEGVD